MADLRSQIEAAVMARGGKKHGAEIRFRCPGHDDEHASADYSPQKAVWICRVCGESGDFWHLGVLLGVIDNGHRVNGFRETRRWDIGGVAIHKRLERQGAKKVVKWERQGKPGLDGLQSAALPLYAAELTTDAEADLLVSEGEKPTDALLALGFYAVGTVTGAAVTPSVESLKPLAEHRGRIFLCQDNDRAGQQHMARIAARLLRMGKRAYIVDWSGLSDKGDAYDYVKTGHTAKDVEALLESAPLYDGNAELQPAVPEIILSGRPLQDKTTDAMATVIASNVPPRIFRHGGGLARVEKTETAQPVIKPLGENAVRGELARAAFWVTIDRQGTVPTTPPLDVVRDFLTVPEGWPNIPIIRGIIQNPVIRPDGSVLERKGYDPDTQLYYYPPSDTQVPTIPATPTGNDVLDASTLLREVFCDFPFDSETSRANVLAALMSPVVRPLVTSPVPLCVIDKPQVGSGATLIAHVIAIITTGRPAAVMTAPKGTDEWRKTITGALLQGRSIVVIDNVEGQLYDRNLAAVLTATTYASRILGTHEIKDVPNLATWIVTGNNVRLGGDLPRRAYLVRIDAGVARPWLRDSSRFVHPELEMWCARNRDRILAALLTLARAWVVAGRPRPANMPLLGGYESWVSVVSGILAHSGIVGFLDNLMELYDCNDVETTSWAAFIEAWHEIFEDKPITCAQVMEELSHHRDFEAVLPIDPPHRDKRTGDIDDSGFTRRLGKALAARDGRIYPREEAEYKLARGGEMKRAQLWQVVRLHRQGEFLGGKLNNTNAKSEFGEFQTTPNADGMVRESGYGMGQNPSNSPSKADSRVDTKLTSNSPGGLAGYSAIIGMSVGQACELWRSEGAPIIHLGPGVNCSNLQTLLSDSDAKPEHLDVVKVWLQKHKGGEQ